MRKILFLALVAAGCATDYHHKHPPKDPGDRRPAVIERKTAQLPEPRLDTNDPARTARELVAWASASSVDERERVRGAIQQISRSETIVRSLCEQAFSERSKDHSRTLIILAVLGETKSDIGERCLTEFVNLPFPMTGHDVQGEILEQTALGTLQAKAVDGLAYRMTASADETVRRLIREHPSRIVRAEAISAYLWNRGDQQEAKASLRDVVRADELIFLDRVRRVPGETAETFNPKLKAFLDQHPELQPPAPVKGRGRGVLVCPKDCVERPADQAPTADGRGN